MKAVRSHSSPQAHGARISHDAAVHSRSGDRPCRARDPRRRRQRRGGAIAGAGDRLRQRARQRLERLFPSHGLSGRLASGTDRRRRRAGRDFARSRGDPLRRQRRDRASGLRPSFRFALASARETFGIALFAQNGSYTTGELGYYPRRLAEAGLVAFAATSGPALMTVAGAKTPVYCTNPIAFAAPLDEGPPLLIDQASSATAFVQLRHYAERGETLPAGWAVDADGAADHRSAGGASRRASRFRRRARRQHRAHGRGHGRGACRRELGARRALVHSRAIARPAPAFLSSPSRRLCSRRTFRSA